MTLGEKIQELRQYQNISQKELAEKLGVSTADVAVWESNESTPSITNIAKLSSVFGVTTDALIINNDIDANTPQNTNAEIIEKEIPFTTAQPTKKISFSKNKLAILIPIIAILIALIGIFAYKIFVPFSKKSSAIEKAASSVVKIYCYDYEGNESATGSGFIAFDDRTVVTNYHVMEKAYTCKVSTEEDKTYEVEGILAYSQEQDLAIIRLKESTRLKVLKLSDSDKIKKGETVTAIGSPLGIKNTVSQGVLSGRLMEDNMDVLQFTAAISNGSSGGALFNEKGQVIGVTYASLIEGQNLNLAIPSELVNSLMIKKTDTDKPHKVSEIYIESRPQMAYLDKFPDAIKVTFEDLKSSPLMYKGKAVIIDTYISSIESGPRGTKYFFSNAENVSGNYDYDESLRTASGITIPYKNIPIMTTNTIYDQTDVVYMDENIEIGNNVIIIGKFDYARVGDINEMTGFASKIEYGVIDLEMIYKK